VGELVLLKRALNLNKYRLKLFTNDYTPTESDTTSDYTEASVTGYSDLTLTIGAWNIATIGATSWATYAEQTFNLSGAVTVYGYHVTDLSGATLIWAERATSAFAFTASGGEMKVRPKISFD
jgi:hypothetical protein